MAHLGIHLVPSVCLLEVSVRLLVIYPLCDRATRRSDKRSVTWL